MEILCIYAGIACVYLGYLYPVLFLCSLFLLTLKLRLIFCFMAGVALALIHQNSLFHAEPQSLEKRLVHVTGQLVSIPQMSTSKTSFEFQLESLDQSPSHLRLLLSCYKNCPQIKAGERWSFWTKLKKPHHYANPGSYDYAQSLASRHIIYNGIIDVKRATRLSSASKSSLMHIRDVLATRMASLEHDKATLGIWQALALGLTFNMSPDDWALFRRTGTTHLMVISGAHIGLVAGLVFKLFSLFWRRFEWACQRMPSARFAALMGMSAATIYALLAGFAVPAQRSLMGCLVAMSRYFIAKRFHIWQGFRYGLLAVLIYEPHAVMLAGFYLSFLAVAILICANQYLPSDGFRKNLWIQMACLIGLFPLTLYWFSYGAVNGFLANIVAIPWVGFVVLPLSLICMILALLCPYPFIALPVHWAIYLLSLFLKVVDRLSCLNVTRPLLEMSSVMAIMIGLIIFFALVTVHFRILAVILILSGFMPAKSHILKGTVRVDVMDVGQGLAIVVRTQSHRLIYDTGMKMFQGSDMGQLVLLPYLKSLQISDLNRIVISHPDLDHRGGLASLQVAFPKATLLVNEPRQYEHAQSCHHTAPWTWDGVRFQFFPITEDMGRNNTSCVLHICTLMRCVLLTGDIEAKAERYLLQHYGQAMHADVLLVPHHGSKTSSTLPFLQAVSPSYAIASYGHDNIYHFPHEQAMQNYQALAIPVYDTMQGGMIALTLGPLRGQLDSYL